MKVIDELRKLGWSEELLTAVGSVAGKVKESAVTQPLVGISGPLASSKDFDAVSITLNAAQLLDSTIVTLPVQRKRA